MVTLGGGLSGIGFCCIVFIVDDDGLGFGGASWSGDGIGMRV